MFSDAKVWKTLMAPNVLLSYSSGLYKIKMYSSRYVTNLQYIFTLNQYSLTNKPNDPNV